ncbi:vancomycin resistance protein VanJ [Microbacterium sp. ZKA21]|uniref:endonuclease/exonuclease/phosphatase family protein n=1 Tax=Microbacterium sp. ZKA21 TaxID=3381694 RepID=UPI003D1EF811
MTHALLPSAASPQRPSSTPRARAAAVRRARALATVSVLLAVWIALGWLPGQVGALVAASLPWVGIAIVGVVVASAVLARRTTVIALAVLVLWLVAMAPALPALPGPAAETSLTVASQNVRADSDAAGDSAAGLAATGADVVAMVELAAASRSAAAAVLDAQYPHSYHVGTVSLWSAYPITDAEPLELGLGWKRALRATVQTPGGDVRVYLMHAASLRPGEQSARDTMLTGIADEMRADGAERMIAVGDFNAASTDPALADLRDVADQVRPTDGSLGMTWPATFPLVRIDQVFQHGMSVLSSTTLPVGASDHRATLTTVGF